MTQISAAYPTVDEGSGNLGTPPALQRVQHAHGEIDRRQRGEQQVLDRRIGKAWRPNTRWVEGFLAIRRGPPRPCSEAPTALGGKSCPVQPTTAFPACSAACSHDLAAKSSHAADKRRDGAPGPCPPCIL